MALRADRSSCRYSKILVSSSVDNLAKDMAADKEEKSWVGLKLGGL